MLDLSRDIDSLSNFKRNSVAFIDRLKQTGTTVVLTVHGKAEIVVQDAKSYQRPARSGRAGRGRGRDSQGIGVDGARRRHSGPRGVRFATP